jgi:hypothetical protein
MQLLTESRPELALRCAASALNSLQVHWEEAITPLTLAAAPPPPLIVL